MSDEQNKNQGEMPDVDSMATEWSRVMSNPDNLIVSDVLRSALPDEFTSEENISSILEMAIEIGELEVVAPLTRLDISKNTWVCQMSVDASDAAVILSYSLDEIQESTVELRDKGNTISTFEISNNDNVSLSVDTDGRVYYVTLTCDKEPEKTNES